MNFWLVSLGRSHLTNFGSPSGNVVLLEGGCVIIASVIIARVSSLVLIVCFEFGTRKQDADCNNLRLRSNLL